MATGLRLNVTGLEDLPSLLSAAHRFDDVLTAQREPDGLAVTLPNKLPTSYAVALKIEGAIPE